MFDYLHESQITLKAAQNVLPGKPHISTVWRFVTLGVRGVRLESFVCAGRRFTTIEAVERFVIAQNHSLGVIGTDTRRMRQHAAERADRALREEGL